METHQNRSAELVMRTLLQHFFFLLLPVGVPVDTHRKVSLFLNSLLIFDMSFGCWIFYSHSLLKKETSHSPRLLKLLRGLICGDMKLSAMKKKEFSSSVSATFLLLGMARTAMGAGKVQDANPKVVLIH